MHKCNSSSTGPDFVDFRCKERFRSSVCGVFQISIGHFLCIFAGFQTMADHSSDGAAKASKRNQKRRAKAKKSGLANADSTQSHVEAEPEVDPVEELRQRLAEAKLEKDHKLASKLRQQLWIVQDLAAGVKPRVDQDDKEGQAMVEEFQKTGIICLQPRHTNTPPVREEKVTPAPAPVSSYDAGDVIEDKRLKTLNKKLKQIESLKEKQKKGEKLEANQLEKIKSEASVRQEIKEIEQLTSEIMAEIKR